MANKNLPQGATPRNVDGASLSRQYIATGETTKHGDTLYRNTAGLITGTEDANYPIVGIQNGAIIDESDGKVNATSLSGDVVMVWDDPHEEFIIQASTFAATTPYTCRVSSACFDQGGTSGALYVDVGASTYDDWKVLRRAAEPDTGIESAIGAYAKVVAQVNPNRHERANFGAA